MKSDDDIIEQLNADKERHKKSYEERLDSLLAKANELEKKLHVSLSPEHFFASVNLPEYLTSDISQLAEEGKSLREECQQINTELFAVQALDNCLRLLTSISHISPLTYPHYVQPALESFSLFHSSLDNLKSTNSVGEKRKRSPIEPNAPTKRQLSNKQEVLNKFFMFARENNQAGLSQLELSVDCAPKEKTLAILDGYREGSHLKNLRRELLNISESEYRLQCEKALVSDFVRTHSFSQLIEFIQGAENRELRFTLQKQAVDELILSGNFAPISNFWLPFSTEWYHLVQFVAKRLVATDNIHQLKTVSFDPIDLFALQKEIVVNLATACSLEQLLEILNQEKDPDKLFKLQKKVIRGFVLGEHIDYLDLLFFQEQPPKRLLELKKEAISILAKNDRISTMHEILTQEKNPGSLFELLKSAVLNLAKTGQTDSLERLILQYSHLPSTYFKTLEEQMLQGFAKGGYADVVKNYLAQVQDETKLKKLKEFILLSCVQRGYIAELKDIFSDADERVTLQLNVIPKLAQEGQLQQLQAILAIESESVVNLRLHQAVVENLAHSQHVELVNHFLLPKGDDYEVIVKFHKWAATTLAERGLMEPIKQIISQYLQNSQHCADIKTCAMQTFAHRGYDEHVIELLRHANFFERDSLQESAVRYYAQVRPAERLANFMTFMLKENAANKTGLCLRALENLIAGPLYTPAVINQFQFLWHAEKLHKDVLTSLIRNGRIKGDTNILHLISHLDDEKLRTIIVAHAKKDNKSLDEPLVLSRAKKLNQLMKEAATTQDPNEVYEDACRKLELWSLPESVHIWFLAGIELVKNDIPYEIFLHISSFILEQTEKECFQLLHNYLYLMPKELHKGATLDTINKFHNTSYSRFFNPVAKGSASLSFEQYQEKIKQADERYALRKLDDKESGTIELFPANPNYRYM